MRLVCPNCEAKYEVPEDAIPDTGRDVQCANCGHAWFQMRQRATPAATAEPVAEAKPAASAADTVAADVAVEAAPAPEPEVTAEPVAPPEAPTPDPVVEVAATAEPASEAVAMPDTAVVETAEGEAQAEAPLVHDAAELVSETAAPEPETARAQDDATSEAVVSEEAQPAGAPEKAAVPYAVDDSVLAILREEAEREANARRAEARPLETQTDLGIEAVVPAAVAMAAAATDADGKPSARRDLFPDVEEINSTLHPSELELEEAGAAPVAQGAPAARSGFRSGFLTVVVLAIVGAVIYIIAPRLGAAVPSLAGTLDSYVAFVDSFRLQLDGMMRSATASLNGG